ncbi:MarR family winged helix-turn-helix transcriptional regulator [Cohnella soli]|uniref:MarR family winged helix-turn-helix transcriptional regulator n=1 Tax=Cohnella soli TaxID=425005 RepID=A0ABW0HWE2_9BACL
MDRVKMLMSYSNKVQIHRRMWETEWNLHNLTDLSVNQFQVLNVLDLTGPKQSKDLVQITLITSGGITSIANKLLEKGLITRTRDDVEDRRAITLAITDEGRQVLSGLRKLQDDNFERLFAPLSNAEIAFLDEIYGKLIASAKG